MIRWAETNGSESNMYRKNAWIYRDYVIRAFNDDKPYDQFLHEQIAGDALGQGDATGFLVAGPHVPVATVGQEPSARRQARADRMDEILQTAGASAMGVTIGCARCHNHKFDPISIQDYYKMSAVFQDVEFGSRFVSTTSDFGTAGAPPTHPELLDWLAAEFKEPTPFPTREGGSPSKAWSVKHLVRLMVMSNAFRQSSLPHEKGLAVDAGSALLWRFPQSVSKRK